MCLIVNPASGGGWSSRELARFRAITDRNLTSFEIRTTEAPGHATSLARRAAEEGFDVVAAVGGDGTAHEVVNGLLERSSSSSSAFGLVHRGTGGDLRRSLAVPASLEGAVRGLATWPLRPIDVLEAHVTPLRGGPQERRWCINVAGFGLNGRVVQLANQGTKRWGGALTFAGASLRAVAEHRPVSVELHWTTRNGTRSTWEGPLASVFLANGSWCGGGMWVGRGGHLCDGLVELTLIPQMAWWRLAIGAPRLFTGTVQHVSGVSRSQVQSVAVFAEPATPVLVELDGELAGRLPARFNVIPKVLRVATKSELAA